ncbi:MAG: class I SAM-dependent methyltransferase [Pirellula sp.]|jgi:16S rRNA (guanine1207-N2)-methyltransferase|nr:class I SAM-dependent methyltransferase [Pirellula sp.]
MDDFDSQFDSQFAKRSSPRLEEKLLIEELKSWEEAKRPEPAEQARLRVLSVSSGRHQAAEWLGQAWSNIEAVCWHIDSFQANRTTMQFSLDSENQSIAQPAHLKVLCAADAPDGPFDLALLSLVSTGETELARDYLQQLFCKLRIGGRLVASVDNKEDTWLLNQLKSFEKSVKLTNHKRGKVYWIEKTAELKKVKDFSCELAFRDCDELIKLVTRPGVFSHRQLDNGARQLLDAVDVYPQARLLDIGCGSGSVALGLAMRDPSAHIHAVDSNARAVDCLLRGMKLNGLENITAEVNPTGIYGEPDSYDMALANPPYYGDFHIAEKFIAAAQRSLRSGGRVVLVNKQPSWYEENLKKWFEDCEVFPSRRYFIASGIKAGV